jgi:Trk K+ transport system NAD-binding subunit
MEHPAPVPKVPAKPAAMPQDCFLVCGLGSLGQHSIANLKSFGVPVHAVNLVAPDQWEVPQVPELIDHLVIGDCRLAEVLDRAGVKRCRAVLLVTQNERVNLEAALTARVLNPRVRLVMRSDKQNLNDLMGQQLNNFIAFEPTQLAAPAFALSAFGEDLLGVFRVDGHRFQVVKQNIHLHHPWRDRRQLYQLDSPTRRVLRHLPASADTDPAEPGLIGTNSPSTQFYTWLPHTPLRTDDEVVLVECDTQLPSRSPQPPPTARPAPLEGLTQVVQTLQNWSALKSGVLNLWRTNYEQQIRRVAILCGLTVAGLCLMGTLLLKFTALAATTFREAFFYTFILLFGGYGDVFGELENYRYPALIQSFSALMTIAGTAFIGVLYALLTEKLLTLRFEFMERRPPVPEKDHVVVVWLGRVGRQVLTLLQDLHQPIVGIAQQSLDSDVLPQVPLLTGDIIASLDKANLATAKSLVAVSDDEIQNLEIGLMAHRVNPQCRAIIRTYDRQFTDRVATIFPFAQVLCASAISAEAFAGAAFGEHVLSLFRLYHQTALVTEYAVDHGDTLNRLLLSEVAYGYGVLPIWHQRPPKAGSVMPSEDLRLHPQDRLVIMATIRGLRRIEQGQLAPKTWTVRVEKALTADALFEGAAEIARISGCKLGTAREFMAHLPATFPQPLYQHQAVRLVRLLTRAQVKARSNTERR